MKTVWYLWAVNDDPVTNEYLAKVIGEGNEEYLFPNKFCADGKERNLFRCPKGMANVHSAYAAIQKHNLKIHVFKEDIEDVIVRFRLLEAKVQKDSKTTRRKAAMTAHCRSATMIRPSRKAI